MPSGDPPPGGVFNSVRALLVTGLALIQNRVELFGVEVEEQKARLVRSLVLAGVAIFLANTAVLVVTATIVLLVPDGARVGVLIGMCVVYVVAAVIAFQLLRKEMASAPPPFRGTISELKKDCDWLKPKD
jgi:uncharacterized membrane protein YqjE